MANIKNKTLSDRKQEKPEKAVCPRYVHWSSIDGDEIREDRSGPKALIKQKRTAMKKKKVVAQVVKRPQPSQRVSQGTLRIKK